MSSNSTEGVYQQTSSHNDHEQESEPQHESPRIEMPLSGHDEFSAEDIQALLAGVEPYHIGQHEDSYEGSFNKKPKLEKASDRTERKRRVEKQRRCEINQQFQNLQTVMKDLESDNLEPLHGLPAYSPSNRVELMSRTCALLKNYHSAHQKLAKRVEELEDEVAQAKKAGEDTAAKLKEKMTAPQSMGGNKVMMMVPMIIGGNDNPMPYMQPYGFPSSGPGSSNNNNDTSNGTAPVPAAVAPQQQNPWGMLPNMMMAPQQWMMQQASFMQGNHATNGNAPASSSSGKRSPTNAGNDMGGNLAHCA